jgi:hypothetical protein
MDDRIIELLYRNLQEVFGEGDASRRRAAIRDFYTEDCVLYVPPGIFVGHDALDKFAGDLRATHPHFVYTPRGGADRLALGGIVANVERKVGDNAHSRSPPYQSLQGI